jgi:superfamily II DNA/RNA helicase
MLPALCSNLAQYVHQLRPTPPACAAASSQVDVVFNIELPSNAAHYAHRAGRTGRMGAPGLVLTLVAPGERFVIERLSKKLGVPIMVRHNTAAYFRAFDLYTRMFVA